MLAPTTPESEMKCWWSRSSGQQYTKNVRDGQLEENDAQVSKLLAELRAMKA